MELNNKIFPPMLVKFRFDGDRSIEEPLQFQAYGVNEFFMECSGLPPHVWNGFNCPICKETARKKELARRKAKLNWLQRRWNDVLYWWNVFIN